MGEASEDRSSGLRRWAVFPAGAECLLLEYSWPWRLAPE